MPTSAKGKAIVRLNAIRTGHRSLTVPLPSEVPEYERFATRMREAYPTQNPIAEELVQRACSLAWRLRRFRFWSDMRIETRTAEAMAEGFKEHRDGIRRVRHLDDLLESIRQGEEILDWLKIPGEPEQWIPEFILGAYWPTFPGREEGPDKWEDFPEEDREAVRGWAQARLDADRAFLAKVPGIEREAWFSGLIPKRSELEDHERVGRLEQSLHRQLLETLTALREFV